MERVAAPSECDQSSVILLRPNFTRLRLHHRRLPIINHLVRTVIERHRSARDHLEHREIPWRYYHSTKLLG